MGSATDTHLRLLDRPVSGASFLTGVCLSVILHIVDLWQYYVCCTRSGVTRCTLLMVLFLCHMCRCGLHAALAHRYTYAPPRCRTSQYSRTFILFSVFLWKDFSDPVFDAWCGTGGFQEQGQLIFIGLAARSHMYPPVFPFSDFILWVGIVELGSSA